MKQSVALILSLEMSRLLAILMAVICIHMIVLDRSSIFVQASHGPINTHLATDIVHAGEQGALKQSRLYTSVLFVL